MENYKTHYFNYYFFTKKISKHEDKGDRPTLTHIKETFVEKEEVVEQRET